MSPALHQLDSKTRKRLQASSFMSMAFWLLGAVLLFGGAPFWAVVLAGAAFCYFTLRDWRTVLDLAHAHMFPPHPDPDVQALIEKKIDISEYRRRKESQDAT